MIDPWLTERVTTGISRRCQPKDPHAPERIGRSLRELVERYVPAVCRDAAQDGDFPWGRFGDRLWCCIDYHWERLSSQEAVEFPDVLKHLESMNDGESSILREVTLAMALELRYPAAAESFEEQWMPLVRATARRVGGPSALDLVENFSADLILPRKDAPPRIAQYQGRTPLSAWLRVVVANHCLSQLRRRRAWTPVEELAEVRSLAAHDHQPCRELLAPLVGMALGTLEDEDRLLLKLLILDEVPQQQVAQLFGVHSGNVTRRRQRAAQSVWRAVAAEAERAGKRQAAGDCLESVLAGNDPALRSELSQQMALQLRTMPEIPS